ncbi:hypothetical protein GQ473_05275, partial [archaeon]|nr:hypothetical protein [archaeon]
MREKNYLHMGLFFVSLLFIAISFVIPVLSAVNISQTSVVSTGDDLFIRSGITEILTIKMNNTGADNITAVNITLPLGFNLVNITNILGWDISNITESGKVKVLYNATGAGILVLGNGTFEINMTLNSTPPLDGSYNIEIVADDNSSNTDSKNLSVVVDNTEPFIEIIYPINNTRVLDGYLDVTFNIIDEWSLNYSCNYSVNGSLIGFETGENITIKKTTIYSDGAKNVSVNCMDDVGNIGYSNITFFNFTKLSVVLLSPNATNKSVDLVNGSKITLLANLTKEGVAVNDSVEWSVIAGGSCPIINSTFITLTSLWEINCSAPYILDNPIYNDIEIFANYTTNTSIYNNSYAVVTDVSINSTKFKDITAPVFDNYYNISLFTASTMVSSIYESNNITLSVNVSDNFVGVDVVYANITKPNGSVVSVNFTNISSIVWAYNYSDTSILGDYNISVFAEDKNNNTANLDGWFEVFKNKTLTGNISDVGVDSGIFNFTIYTSGTKQVIQNFIIDGGTQTDYSVSVHDRIVDLNIDVDYSDFGEKHKIYIEDVNFTNATSNSLLIQINRINTTNTSLDDIGFGNNDDIFASKGIVGFSVNDTLLHGNVRLVFNYSSMISKLISENNLRVYKTSELIVPGSSLLLSDWSELSGQVINMSEKTISINVTGFSSYIVAQRVSELGSPSADDSGSSSGTGGSSSGSIITAICGNFVCEANENSINCPLDCGTYEFDMSTTMANVRLSAGENKTYDLVFENNMDYDLSVILSVLGDISKFVVFDETNVSVISKNKTVSMLTIRIPGTIEPGTYTGTIIATSKNSVELLPIQVIVSIEGSTKITLNVEPLLKKSIIDTIAKFNILLYNVGYRKDISITIDYYIKNVETDVVELHEVQEIKIKSSSNFVKEFFLNSSQIVSGEHYLETVVTYGGGNMVKKSVAFIISDPFWSAGRIRLIGFWLILLFATLGVAYTLVWYNKQKILKARYLFPTDFSKLPKLSDGAFWLGNIADTRKKSAFDP